MTRILTLLWIFIAFGCSSANAESSVTLYLDDGTAENGFRIGGGMGHSVLFEAPSGDWALSSVAVYGKLEQESSGSGIFVLEIWDDELNVISKVTDRADAFFGEEFSWAVVDVPDVWVSGFFLVSLYEFGGIYVGTDIGPATNRSFISARNPNRILAWNLAYKQNETEWMIRATGSSPPPEVVDLLVLSYAASSGGPIEVEVEVRDPDHNLKSATLYVIENDSREVVWSEAREVEGGEASVVFSWPGTFYMVTGPDGTVSPVLTSDVANFSEKLRPLLARSSPCVLLLDSGESTVSAYAYFGDDGDLNALIDLSGRVHYVSRDVLNAVSPEVDYMEYLAKNGTAIKEETSLVFYRLSAQAGSGTLSSSYHQPIVLSRSPLFNYRISLEEVDAEAGDYLPIVMVEDQAYNVVQFSPSTRVITL